MTRFLRGALRTLTLLFVVSCGSDAPTRPAGPVSVQVAVTPASLMPGKTVQLVVTATPPAGENITSLQFSISGVLSYADSTGYTRQGVATMTRSITLPMLTGEIVVTATAHGTGGSVGTQQASYSLADLVVPVITASAYPSSTPGIVQEGDSIQVQMHASDDVSLSYLLLRSTGAIVATDSAAAWTPPVYDMMRSVSVGVPASAPLNRTFTLTAETKDLGGNVVRKDLGTYTVRDLVPPAIRGAVVGARANGVFAAGDTALVTLAASDNRALSFSGVQLGGVTIDSMATNGKTAERTARVVLPATGTYSFSVFAIDSGGSRTQVSLAPVTVVANRSRLPVASLPVGGGYDIAWDQGRNRIYVSQPDSGQIAVLAGDGSSRLPSFSVTPGRPWGIDVSNGGDSLVIALRGTAALGFLNLVTGNLDTTTVVTNTAQGRTPQNVRVSSNNRALFTITFNGTGYGGTMTEFQLGTGLVAQWVSATETVPLAATGDRQRVYGLSDNTASPEQAYYYDARVSFSNPGSVVSGPGVGIATDFTGAHFLAGTTFMTGEFVLLRNLAPTGALTNAVALSKDGSYAYFATSTGFVKMRTADGAEVERVTLGHAPTHFRTLPDGVTLVATSATTVDVIDLW